MVHVAGIVTSQELHGGRAVEHCLEMQKIARIVFEKEKEKLKIKLLLNYFGRSFLYAQNVLKALKGVWKILKPTMAIN